MNSDFCVAVHALVYLNHKACVLSSEELAENICTNPARVRKVMARLTKAGLLDAKEGSVGGYRFSCGADQVSLEQIADALGTRFVDAAWQSGSSEMECLVASGMAGLMSGVFDDLDQRCRDRLREIHIADLDRKIFGAADNRKDV